MSHTPRRINMARNALSICFFGPSGSGKSTCFEMARDAMLDRLDLRDGARVHRADVAEPLHDIQRAAYDRLGLDSTGQDGRLLSFLADHFGPHLGTAIRSLVDRACESRRPCEVAFVNTDCRNNAYDTLHELGFWFVRVAAPEGTVRDRLSARGDTTPHNPSAAVEQIGKIAARWTINNGGSLGELREQVGNVVQAAIFRRGEFMSA